MAQHRLTPIEELRWQVKNIPPPGATESLYAANQKINTIMRVLLEIYGTNPQAG